MPGNVRVRAELHAPTDPGTDPEPGLLVGTNEGRFSELETAMDGPALQVRRSYCNDVDDALSHISADYAAGRVPWVSLSSWPSTGDIDSLMAAIDRTTMVTYLHEVDNGPKLAAGTFCSRMQTLIDAKAGNPYAKVGPILTAGPWRSQSAGSFMDYDGADFNGVDAYRYARPAGSPDDPKVHGLGTPRTMAYLIGEEDGSGDPISGGGALTWAQDNGAQLALGEFGCHWFPSGNAANRPDWIAETFAYLRAADAFAACWFHSPLGESGPWLVDQIEVYTDDQNDPDRLTGDPDPDSLAALKTELETAIG